MPLPSIQTRPWLFIAAGVLLGAATVLLFPEYPSAQEKEGAQESEGAEPEQVATAGMPADQKAFPTPEEAGAALIAACEADDTAAIVQILGAKHKHVYVSADPVADRKDRGEYAAKAKLRVRYQNLDDTTVEMIVGPDGWPSPVPLVKAAEGWYFDMELGADEILSRRIGANELDTIETLRGYIDAQIEYASKDRDGDRVLEYAQKLRSSAGKQDGLYWETPEGSEDVSPMGPMIAESPEMLAASTDKKAYGGYFYKPLTRQGAKAPGGAHDYIINGNMIAGVAGLAYPAEYGETGIMTFLVSHHGDVLEKDLGKETAAIALKITEFDPDDTWKVVVDEDE